ncbi:hypothetical protein M514_05357, partial [Trichuris suis]
NVGYTHGRLKSKLHRGNLTLKHLISVTFKAVDNPSGPWTNNVSCSAKIRWAWRASGLTLVCSSKESISWMDKKLNHRQYKGASLSGRLKNAFTKFLSRAGQQQRNQQTVCRTPAAFGKQIMTRMNITRLINTAKLKQATCTFVQFQPIVGLENLSFSHALLLQHMAKSKVTTNNGKKFCDRQLINCLFFPAAATMSANGKVRTSLTLPEHAKVFSSNWKNIRESMKTRNDEQKNVPPKENRRRRYLRNVLSRPCATLCCQADRTFSMRVGRNRNKSKETLASTEMEKKVERLDDCLRMSEVLALDCEFVGGGFDGSKDILARVSLVDGSLRCVYDKFVKTEETIVDYRTAVSGVRPENVANGESLPVVRREVAALISRRVLVGHGVRKDLDVIGLTHSRRLIRDTSTFPLFHKMLRTRLPKLRVLSATLLGEEIQNGEHDSVFPVFFLITFTSYASLGRRCHRRNETLLGLPESVAKKSSSSYLRKSIKKRHLISHVFPLPASSVKQFQGNFYAVILSPVMLARSRVCKHLVVRWVIFTPPLRRSLHYVFIKF